MNEGASGGRSIVDPAGAGTAVLCVHHLISDGLSREFIRRDVVELLAGREPLNRTQFSSHLLSASQTDTETDNTYWLSELRGFLPSPRFISPQHVKDLSAQSLTAAIDVDIGVLKNLLSQLKISLFSYLLAHFFLALARLTKRKSQIVRVTVHGREQLDEASTLGCLFSAVPICVEGPNVAPRKQAESLHAKLADARKHQNVKFEELAAQLEERQDAFLHPITGVTFALDGYDPTAQLPQELCQGPRSELCQATLPHELFATLKSYQNGCAIRFMYRTQAFKRRQIKRLWLDMQESIRKDIKGVT